MDAGVKAPESTNESGRITAPEPYRAALWCHERNNLRQILCQPVKGF